MNIVLTTATNANYVIVEYNNLTQYIKKVKLDKRLVRSVGLSSNENYVEIFFSDNNTYQFPYTYVSEVDGTVITSGTQLYDLLSAMMEH